MPVTAFVNKSKVLKGPDPVLVKDQLTALQGLLRAYGHTVFAEQMFWILRKNPEKGERKLKIEGWNKRLVPYRLNNIQKDLIAKLGDRNICLKMRQGGYTTFFINMRLYLPAITEPGSGNLLISQNNLYGSAHFLILQRTHRYVGAIDPYDPSNNLLTQQLHDNLLHTKYSSRKEIIFDQLDSRVMVGSAEVSEVGQGITLQHLVCTEVARWPGTPEETLANVKEAVAEDGSVDLESTANGLGGYFYEECMRARDKANKLREFVYHFHEWWHHEEYRDLESAEPDSLTEEETELRKKFKVDLHQILWRRKKQVTLRHNFDEKYPEDDITCFLVSGKTFFDRDILRRRLMELMNYKPLEVWRAGEFVQFKKRVKGRRYVIGADPATGRTVKSDDTDFCAAVVLDEETGEEVGAYCARVPPEDFGDDLVDIAKQYNNAMIAVERTGDGTTCLLQIQGQRQFWNIYKHKEVLKGNKKTVIELPGFPTTPKTRPIAVNKLAHIIREDPEMFWDKAFIEEALTFVRDEKGKPAGAEGVHDDRVMCRAIAHIVRLVNLGFLDPITWRSERYGDEPQSDDQAGGGGSDEEAA